MLFLLFILIIVAIMCDKEDIAVILAFGMLLGIFYC